MTIEKLFSGQAVFLKFWYINHIEIYNTTALPGGEKEGVSGSTVYSNNVGICRYITKDNIKAAAEVIKFFTMRETQKEFIIGNNLYSGINNLYQDEEVCATINCNVMRDAQPFSCRKNNFAFVDLDYYYEKYRKLITGYLCNDMPLMNVLKEVNNILIFHYFTLKTDDSAVGLVFFIITIFIYSVMGSFIIFLFLKKYNALFTALPKDFWILSVFGSMLQLSGIFCLYGQLTGLKCELQIILLDFGLLLSLIPILYKLIINFPDPNKYSRWIEHHRYLFLLCIIFINVILYGLMFIPAYTTKKFIQLEGDNFEICKLNGIPGKVIISLIITLRGIFFIVIILLLFIEWNIENTYYDIQFFTGAILMNIFSLIIYYITDSLNIENYLAYYAILASVLIIFSTSNYIFIYAARIIYTFFRNDEEESSQKFLKIIQKNTKRFSISDSLKASSDENHSFATTTSSRRASDPDFCPRKTSFKRTSELSNILISYHYRESIG
ncbi:hypothetical protein PIROE2DRAFT_19462 [Piromyces sp. E2]|nr:hypothetical protein PIROE2DRAFT_19462 [Piromyces sp. E2]|eukprot:OUM70661.1 hypothetical protein PIROE2DRAFT_19462 [Piromyces sp. E2]